MGKKEKNKMKKNKKLIVGGVKKNDNSLSFFSRAFLFSLFLFVMSVNSDAEIIVDRVVARVNDKVILLSEFNSRAEPAIQEYKRIVTGETSEQNIKELKNRLLDQMIDEKLLLQRADKVGIRITDSEVDVGIDEIRGRFQSEIEFQNEISRQAISKSEFRKNVRNQLKTIKLINQEVRSQVLPPTEEEMRRYYEENKEEMISPEQARARHILIMITEDTSQEKARKKIDKIYKKVKANPARFSSYAEELSECPSGRVGGDLGYFPKGAMVKEFSDVAFALEIGGISEPVKTRFGYHIIKLVGKRSREKRTFTEVRDHLRNLMHQIRMEREYERFLRKLRDGAKISKSLTK